MLIDELIGNKFPMKHKQEETEETGEAQNKRARRPPQPGKPVKMKRAFPSLVKSRIDSLYVNSNSIKVSSLNVHSDF